MVKLGTLPKNQKYGHNSSSSFSCRPVIPPILWVFLWPFASFPTSFLSVFGFRFCSIAINIIISISIIPLLNQYDGWASWPPSFFVVESVVCIVRCSAASQDSVNQQHSQQHTPAPTTKNVNKISPVQLFQPDTLLK